MQAQININFFMWINKFKNYNTKKRIQYLYPARMKFRLTATVAASALMLGLAAPAFAGSFYLQEQSVRGAGR